MSTAARALSTLLAVVGAAACREGTQGGAEPAGPWTPPTSAVAAKRCAELAGRDGARWADGPRVTVDAGPLVVGDAGALGGPTVAPVRVDVPRGAYASRVLVERGRVSCMEIRFADAAGSSAAPLGTVALDSDTLLVADEGRARAARAARGAVVDVTFETDGEAMPRVLAALEAKARKPERLSPTLARLRDARPDDAAIVAAVMKDQGAYGRVHREPESQGLVGILDLGSEPFAPSPSTGGLLVDAAGGFRAYTVIGVREGERLVALEWSSP